MTRLLLLLCLVCAFGGCATVSEAGGVGYPFTFEVRIPKTASPDMKTTRAILLAHHGRNVAYLWSFKEREEDPARIDCPGVSGSLAGLSTFHSANAKAAGLESMAASELRRSGRRFEDIFKAGQRGARSFDQPAAGLL